MGLTVKSWIFHIYKKGMTKIEVKQIGKNIPNRHDLKMVNIMQ